MVGVLITSIGLTEKGIGRYRSALRARVRGLVGQGDNAVMVDPSGVRKVQNLFQLLFLFLFIVHRHFSVYSFIILSWISLFCPYLSRNFQTCYCSAAGYIVLFTRLMVVVQLYWYILAIVGGKAVNGTCRLLLRWIDGSPYISCGYLVIGTNHQGPW